MVDMWRKKEYTTKEGIPFRVFKDVLCQHLSYTKWHDLTPENKQKNI